MPKLRGNILPRRMPPPLLGTPATAAAAPRYPARRGRRGLPPATPRPRSIPLPSLIFQRKNVLLDY